MTSTEPRTDIFEHRPGEPMSDALLLQATRDGSNAAFGILYARHRDHAVSVARRTLGREDASLAEDVVEAAFIDVLNALRRGSGPADTLRFYLITTVRRQAWRAQRRQRRQGEVAERWLAASGGVEGATATGPAEDRDPADALGAHALLSTAFRDLPERWRHVLWLTEVEGRKPAEVSELLGVSAGTASALAYRARRGLATAYLAAYGAGRDDDECKAIAPKLAAYLAAGSPSADVTVRRHLEHCASCRDAARGIDTVGTSLGALAPFGLLTAGLWAKVGVAAGGAKALAAAGGAVGALGAAGAATSTTSGSTTAAAGAASGGTGIVAAAVAVAAAIVLVVGGIVAFAGDGKDRGSSDVAASIAGDGTGDPGGDGGTQVEGVSTSAPVTRNKDATTTTTTTTTPPTSTTSGPSTTTATHPAPTTTTTHPRVPTKVPLVPSTVPSSVPTTTTTTTTPTIPTSTTTTTTTPTIPTTTTPTEPQPDTGALLGRVVAVDDPASPSGVGVPGVVIRAFQPLGSESFVVTSGADGRWSIPEVPEGTYLVLADVPATYRPASGIDPWFGGDTWTAVLGLIRVDDQPIDLVDLQLRRR